MLLVFKLFIFTKGCIIWDLFTSAGHYHLPQQLPMQKLSTSQLVVLIEQSTLDYNQQELDTFSIGYLRNFLNKFILSETEPDEAIAHKIAVLLQVLPNKDIGGQWNDHPPMFKEIAMLKEAIRKKYNFVPKGHYKRVFLPLGVAFGMPLGLPIGAALGNVALGLPLGIPFGIPIGLAIGARLDRMAEREERAL